MDTALVKIALQQMKKKCLKSKRMKIRASGIVILQKSISESFLIIGIH